MMPKKQHIIVFRLSAMGDVAMAVPIIRAFVAQYPEVQLTVVSKPFLAPIFNGIKNVSFFAAEVSTRHKGIFGLIRLFKDLKKKNPSHFADLHNVTRSIVVRNLFWFSTPIAYINKGRAEKKALTRIKNKVFKQLKTSHERYADVFKKLGFPIDMDRVEIVKKPILSPSVLKVTNSKNCDWIGIAPFAAFPSKVYPMDLMLQVIPQLSKHTCKIFLFGGKQDVSVLESLAKPFENVLSVANKLDGLGNEIALISHLDVMLSMDSGNAHLAAMQQVKTITLWGATHPFAGFSPFNQPTDFCILPDLQKYPNLPCSVYGNKVCKGYENVMESISPDIIVKKVLAVITK